MDFESYKHFSSNNNELFYNIEIIDISQKGKIEKRQRGREKNEKIEKILFACENKLGYKRWINFINWFINNKL